MLKQTDQPTKRQTSRVGLWFAGFVALACLVLAAWSGQDYARQAHDLTVEHTRIGETPVTLYRAGDLAQQTPVVVAHGFGGSRQMMHALSTALARAGHPVLAFDFIGHGRHPGALSRDITTLEGTTRQLVDQTQTMIQSAAERFETDQPPALLGHSMATDILIRAAEERGETGPIVAISMYSDAVTQTFPARLLIISGEWEPRLREVGLEKLHLVDPQALEGTTATGGTVERRAVFAPMTEHVGVLYSPKTLQEAVSWIGGAPVPPAPPGPAMPYAGLAIPGLLLAIWALFWPVSKLLPAAHGPALSVSPRHFAVIAVLPPLFAGGALFLPVPAPHDLAVFGPLAGFFGVWGMVQLALLRPSGLQLRRIDILAAALLLFWGLGIFALTMDHIWASFVPGGPRFAVMMMLCLGTIPFMAADQLLSDRASWWRIGALRIPPLVTLGTVMGLQPTSLGVGFTVLPVLVLFYLVYGTMGRGVARRTGPVAPALALGIILAWAIAASTPLFSAQ